MALQLKEEQTAEILTERLFRHLHLTEDDLRLLALYFNDALTPEALAAYYRTIRIEDLPYQNVCILVEIARRLRYEGVPVRDVPRLKGAILHIELQNTMRLSTFLKVLKRCNEKGIPVMAFKGAAMKVCYQKERIRSMGDVDYIVPLDRFDEADRLTAEVGFDKIVSSTHHKSYTNASAVLELHNCLLKENSFFREQPAELWENAVPVTWQNEQLLVPSPELMLVTILANTFYDIVWEKKAGGEQTKWLKWIPDCAWILKSQQVDFSQVRKLARAFGVGLQVGCALRLLRRIDERLVPEDAVGVFEPEWEDRRMVGLIRQMSETEYDEQDKYAGEAGAYFRKRIGQKWLMHRYFCACAGRSAFGAVFSFPRFIMDMYGVDSVRGAFGEAARTYRKLKKPKEESR